MFINDTVDSFEVDVDESVIADHILLCVSLYDHNTCSFAKTRGQLQRLKIAVFHRGNG